ncbi:unnamed protein product [Kluyveromyces dobzhanskii CBS 2104]|uniref:WGS project CCBQ000000000 data, contig 00008 n=1 Tax=Kluyveromyces dobzhanskii CBS 2104 TaxID=1427455 RepID=A0A0A8L9X2_9SACH|nr:unnamed protein product [Kluyveromyces dobzhanskii CBS 2104]
MIVSIYINDRRQETLFQYSTVAECPTFRQLVAKLQGKDEAWESKYSSEVNSELKVCRHVSLVNPVVYWCLTSKSEPTVSVISLLEEIDSLLLQYFDKDQMTKQKINNNLDRLSMLFHCILDGGQPVITESNRLKAMIPSKNDLSKMFKTTTSTITKTLQQSDGSLFKNGAEKSRFGTGRYPGSPASSISSFNVGSPGSSAIDHSVDESGIPWRMSGVNYTNNELFVDMIEEINASLDKGRLTTGHIKGYIELNNHLSGEPLVEMDLNLSEHRLSHLNSTFHRCIIEDKANSLDDLLAGKLHKLSFVPPDGRTRLCQYTIPLTKRDSNLGLIDVNLQSGLGKRLDEFEVRVTVGMSTTVKEVEGMSLTIKMNRNFKGAVRVMRNTHGGVETNMSRGEVNWHLDKNIVCGSMAVLRCIAELEPEVKLSDVSSSQSSLAQLPAAQTPPGSTPLLKPTLINCRYQHKSQLPSGIKLRSIDVVNAGANKPFKGVKYLTKTGTLEFR